MARHAVVNRHGSAGLQRRNRGPTPARRADGPGRDGVLVSEPPRSSVATRAGAPPGRTPSRRERVDAHRSRAGRIADESTRVPRVRRRDGLHLSVVWGTVGAGVHLGGVRRVLRDQWNSVCDGGVRTGGVGTGLSRRCRVDRAAGVRGCGCGRGGRVRPVGAGDGGATRVEYGASVGDAVGSSLLYRDRKIVDGLTKTLV